WIDKAIQERAPHVIRCMDTFHVVQWATRALDDVRREVWNDLRLSGEPGLAKHLKNARWVLWHNPENLSPSQQATLSLLDPESEQAALSSIPPQGVPPNDLQGAMYRCGDEEARWMAPVGKPKQTYSLRQVGQDYP